MKSYIYILKESNKPLIKIGKSNNPHARLINLNAIHSFSLYESYVIEVGSEEAAYRCETALHNLFNKNRKIQHGDGGTEFFDDCIIPDVENICELIAKDNNSKIDKDYFKRFFVGVDNVIYQTNNCDNITATLFNIGQRCKSLRLNKNIKQEDLAQICSLSVGTIKSAEQGKVKLENLLKILSVLGDNTLNEILNNILPSENQRACKHLG